MFLTVQPQSITDFLGAVNFIAPAGYTLQYFITPYYSEENNPNSYSNYNPPANSGYSPIVPYTDNSTSVVPGVTDTITYTKKDLDATHSFSQPTIDLNAVPNEMPKNQVSLPVATNPLTGQGGIIESPVKLDRRTSSDLTEEDVQLHESFMGFPNHTLFHFVKD